MEKFLKWCGVAVTGVLLAAGVVSTLVVPVMATEDGEQIQPRSAVPTSSEQTKAEIPPTFVAGVDESEENAHLWMGKNFLIAGNNIKVTTNVPSGLMFAAGNTLNLVSESEYGFVAGNIVNYAGTTTRDLFLAGNAITLEDEAKIGRDVYVASDTLVVETDLNGDLAATVATVELRDVKVAGNVNLTAEKIKFVGKVEIAGALTYNENAEVSGLDNATYGSIEAYEVREISPAARIVASVYGKVLSIAALFIVMALICAIYPRLHQKVATEDNVNRFGINLASGFGVLLLIPIAALLAFISFILAPLGMVALALYAVIIYLSQGFAGLWLGHLIVEKGFKSKGNVFAEAFIGIMILGLASLIPYLGEIIGFIGLILGLGLILQCIKPVKNTTPKISAKLNSGKEK